MFADLDTPLDTSPAIVELTDRIKNAAAARTPLRIRGGGSKDFYAQSLQGDVLDMTGLSGVTSYEPSELVVTALAGTPLPSWSPCWPRRASACRLSRRISARAPLSEAWSPLA